jgi:hypothetical protein
MNPVEYTIALQRFFLILAGTSFLGLALIMVFLDPTVNLYYIFIFLGILFLLLISLITLLAFWWFFSIKKEILTIPQVNQLVSQSTISSGMIVMVLALQQTRQLTLWSGLIIIICYALYQLWANSKSS